MTVYVDNLLTSKAIQIVFNDLFSCWQQRVPAPASICVIALPRRFAGMSPVTGLRRALMYSFLNTEYVKTAFLSEP